MRLRKLMLAAVGALLLPSCFYDVYDGNAHFLEEQQGVWQNLRVYSIYQELLPPEVGNLTPKELFDIIDDRLYGGRYTGYLGACFGGGSPGDPPTIPGARPVASGSNTLYFHVPDFTYSTLTAFTRAAREGRDYDNIILDFSYNGGGLISVAEHILDSLLPPNSEFIRYRRREYDPGARRGQTYDVVARTQNDRVPALAGKKIALIINEFSASSSEIVAAGVKDAATDGRLVGITSYGKGIGQVCIPRNLFGADSALLITSLNISGVKTGDYHKSGIEPDELPAGLSKEMDTLAVYWALLVNSTEEEAKEYRSRFREEQNIVKDFYQSLLGSPQYNTRLISGRREMLRAQFCAARLLDPNYNPPPVPEEMRELLAEAAGQLLADGSEQAKKRTPPDWFRPTGACEIAPDMAGMPGE